VIHDLPKWEYVQTLLSMGDRRVGDILLLVHQANGDWTAALKNSYINPNFEVYQEKGKDEILSETSLTTASKRRICGESIKRQ
jgi:hypothetical protein